MMSEFSHVCFGVDRSGSVASVRQNEVIEQTKNMKRTFSLMFSTEAIAAMAADILACSTVESTLSDLIHGMTYLAQPIKLTGASAILETQIGPWLCFLKIARQAGWNRGDSRDVVPALNRLSPSDSRGLAAAVQRAVSMEPVIPIEAREGLEGLLAVCDGGEVEIEHAMALTEQAKRPLP